MMIITIMINIIFRRGLPERGLREHAEVHDDDRVGPVELLAAAKERQLCAYKHMITHIHMLHSYVI